MLRKRNKGNHQLQKQKENKDCGIVKQDWSQLNHVVITLLTTCSEAAAQPCSSNLSISIGNTLFVFTHVDLTTNFIEQCISSDYSEYIHAVKI